jgi:hypothetical protein
MVWYHYTIFLENGKKRYGDVELTTRPLAGEIIIIGGVRYKLDPPVHMQHERVLRLELRPE